MKTIIGSPNYNELQFLRELLKYYHQSKNYDRGLNNHLSSMIEKLLLYRSDDPEGTKAVNEVLEMIKNHKLKLQYHDWCNIMKVQMTSGSFHEIKPGFIAVKLTSFLHKHVKNYKRDLQFMMAAVFMGFEKVLEPVYPYYYYSVAENRGVKNAYFRENSLLFEGVAIPYHAVYAALVKELPHSIYTQTGRNIKRKLKDGMLGFPEVWSQYSWNDFQTGYKKLNDKFQLRTGRSIEPADLIVAGLTHTNNYHGLRLFDQNECPKLSSWIENLSEEHRRAIEYFENSAWKRLAD